MKNLLLIAMLFITYSFKGNVICDFNPKYIYAINENTDIVKSFKIQVLHNQNRPEDVKLHVGLEAVAQLCTQSWAFRTVESYSSLEEANRMLEVWKNNGYVDAFVINTYTYVPNNSISANYKPSKPVSKPDKVYAPKIEKDEPDTSKMTNTNNETITPKATTDKRYTRDTGNTWLPIKE